jgi:hypothetical protein
VMHFQKKSETSLSQIIVQTSNFSLSNIDWKPNSTITIPNFKLNSAITTYFCEANAPPYFKLYSQYIFYA